MNNLNRISFIGWIFILSLFIIDFFGRYLITVWYFKQYGFYALGKFNWNPWENFAIFHLCTSILTLITLCLNFCNLYFRFINKQYSTYFIVTNLFKIFILFLILLINWFAFLWENGRAPYT